MRLLPAFFRLLLIVSATAVLSQKTSRQEQALFSGEKMTVPTATQLRYDVSIENEMGIKLGSEHGIGLTSLASAISDDVLAVIMQGVEQGNADNTYFFGLMKYYGKGVNKDPMVAVDHFKKAAALGNKHATTALGVCLMHGLPGLQQDMNAAVSYFRKGVELQDMNSMWLLGRVLRDQASKMDFESPKRHSTYVEAATYLLKAAEEGKVPQANHDLALMYEYGMGVPPSYSNAHKYYTRAVEMHEVESMYNLALMYTYGRGPDTGGEFTQNAEKAIRLFELAAAANHAQSIYYIGVLKAQGFGYKANLEQALQWFQKAAALSDYRISDTAMAAADEIRKVIKEANDYQDRTISKYRSRNL